MKRRYNQSPLQVFNKDNTRTSLNQVSFLINKLREIEKEEIIDETHELDDGDNILVVVVMNAVLITFF